MKTNGTAEAWRAHLQSVRWADGPVCPKCGTIGQAGRVGSRPGVLRFHACKGQFSVTVDTAMERTHLPPNIWYLAMYLMPSTAKPISAMSPSRQMQIQYRTCWHLLHRRRAMLSSGETLPLSGIIEADETSVGGKPGNRQKHRPPLTARGRGTDKPMVLAAVERGGEARTAIVAPAGAMVLDP